MEYAVGQDLLVFESISQIPCTQKQFCYWRSLKFLPCICCWLHFHFAHCIRCASFELKCLWFRTNYKLLALNCNDDVQLVIAALLTLTSISNNEHGGKTVNCVCLTIEAFDANDAQAFLKFETMAIADANSHHSKLIPPNFCLAIWSLSGYVY